LTANAGHEIAGHELDTPSDQSWEWWTWN